MLAAKSGTGCIQDSLRLSRGRLLMREKLADALIIGLFIVCLGVSITILTAVWELFSHA